MRAFTLQTSQPTRQLLLHSPRLLGQQHRHGSTRHALHESRAQKWGIATALRQHEATALAQTPLQQQGPTVLLPLDFYGVLGVTRTAGAKSVRDALDKALGQRPEAYYSSDTVALRDLLLRDAADCLLNYEKRREYDAKGPHGYLFSVSEDHLPGALVLLQESGYSQLVLELGTEWLAANRRDVRRRDVAAALALAHHALAVQGLQQEAGCMLEACRHLESALLLIRQSISGSEHAATVSDLQRGIMQLLKDYSPDYCLALLALPLDDPQRPRAHALLRKLLWELPDQLSPLGADKDDFLAAARPLMTPQEHLDLHGSAPKGALSVQQQQVHIEATVAVAFQRRQPLLMLQAAIAFQQLEQAAAQEAEVNMCVERGSIALLLGNTDQALKELGLPPQAQQPAGSNPTQQAAQQYVLAHCPDSSDLLPGVYALAQCWMQQGILGPFRQQSGAVSLEQQPQEPGDMDLAPWFDSLLVRLVILAFAAIDKVKQGLQAVVGLPAAVAASLAWLQQLLSASKQVATSASGKKQASAAEACSTKHSSCATGKSSRLAAATNSSVNHQAQGSHVAFTSTDQQGSSTSAHQESATTARGPQQQNRQQQQQGSTAPQPGRFQKVSEAAKLDADTLPEAQQRQTAAGSHANSSSKHQPNSSSANGNVLAADSAGRSKAAAVAEASSKTGAAAEAGASLMARARAAAVNNGGLQHADKSTKEEDMGPEVPPAVRWRLSQQMSALEVQMWDSPEPAGWRASLAQALSVLLVGAAVVVVVSGSRQQLVEASSVPPGQATLLYDARG